MENSRIQSFVQSHEAGLTITLDAACHDPSTERLLAPEILLVLEALDRDPDTLRACWPEDRDPHELSAIADAFGRPYSD